MHSSDELGKQQAHMAAQQALPINDRQQQASKATSSVLDDAYLIHSYKVLPCKRKYAHDWASCPCGHKGERAARRDLKTQPYMAIACHYAKQRMPCPMGDKCVHAHNLFEYWLHPQRFKTELCQFGSSCDRPVCFFGHSVSELRALEPGLPPAEACWSAGAALSHRGRQQQQHQHMQQHQQQHQQHMMGMQPAGMAGYSGQRMPGHPAMQAPGPSMMVQQSPQQQQQQQQQVVMVASPHAYSNPGGQVVPAGMQQFPQQQYLQQQSPRQQLPQQQVILLQQSPSIGGAVAGGYASMPMSSTGVSGFSAGGMQGAYMPAQAQAPQLQPQGAHMQIQAGQMQYSAAAGNQATYVWLQVPDRAGSGSGGAYVGAGGSMQVAGVPMTDQTVAHSGMQPVQGGMLPHQQQQTMPAQGAYVQSPQMQALACAPGGFMPPLSAGGAGAHVVVCGGMQGVPELQQQPGTAGNWQYGLYPAGDTLQAPTADGVLVDFQNMQLAPGM